MTRLPWLWISLLLSSSTLAGRILKVFGRLPSGGLKTGCFEVLAEEGPFCGEKFFLESAHWSYKIVPEESSGGEDAEDQYTDGPLIPIEYGPFGSSLDWHSRSGEFIHNLDLVHLRVLGEYLVRFIIPEQTPHHPVFFVENPAEFEYLISLCFSEQGWELGWIVPHVPHHLLHQLENHTKLDIMDILIIGENHRGAWVSQSDYSRVRAILDPFSTTQSFQSSMSMTEESNIDESDVLEKAVARMLGMHAGKNIELPSKPQNAVQSLDQSQSTSQGKNWMPSTTPNDMTLRMASIQRIRAARAQRLAEQTNRLSQLSSRSESQVDPVVPAKVVVVAQPKDDKVLTTSRRKRKDRAKKRIEELRHQKLSQPAKPKSEPRYREPTLSYHHRDMSLIAALIQN